MSLVSSFGVAMNVLVIALIILIIVRSKALAQFHDLVPSLALDHPDADCHTMADAMVAGDAHQYS